MTAPSVVASGRSWAKEIVELYAQGYSDAEVAAEMKITIKEYYSQISDNATFAKLVEFGRTLSQAFWEGAARKNLANKQFNTPLWSFYMKNKFNWADKTESKVDAENTNYDIDTLRARVAKELAEHLKRNTPELVDAQRILMTPTENDDE